MAEHIERAAAVKAVLRMRRPENSVAQNRMLSIIQMDILKLPAADVAPVVRGRPCVKTRTVQMTGYHEELGTRAADGSTLYRKAMAHVDVPYEYCPVCGATLCSRWRNYCGKCGAKMDGGVDDAAD